MLSAGSAAAAARFHALRRSIRQLVCLWAIPGGGWALGCFVVTYFYRVPRAFPSELVFHEQKIPASPQNHLKRGKNGLLGWWAGFRLFCWDFLLSCPGLFPVACFLNKIAQTVSSLGFNIIQKVLFLFQ